MIWHRERWLKPCLAATAFLLLNTLAGLAAGEPAPPAPAPAGNGAAAATAPAETFEVNASQILITYAGLPDAKTTRTREEAQTLAVRLAGELTQAPDRFAAYVEQYSEGAKAEAGSVGPFRRGRMSPAFENAVFGLAVNDITPIPVETPYGFHILKRTAVPAVYSARFILISWDTAGRKAGLTVLRTEEEAQKLCAKVSANLQAHPENFRENMMAFSDDAFKHRGGLLPDFYPGRADPALVAAVEKLPILGVAPPFKSQYGFMIVQRLELLRDRPILQGYASACHLVVSYAGADGVVPPGVAAPSLPTGQPGDDGGDMAVIQARNWGMARDRAIELVRIARADPKQFPVLIRQKSDVLDGRTGGDLGFVNLKQTPPGLYDWGLTLQNLKVGEISDPVETGAGFDILMRKELPVRLRARQILIAWAGKLPQVVRSQAAAAAQGQKYLAALKAVPRDQLEKAFAADADKYSDDNAGKGGDLGTFAPESYFPVVTNALLKLQIGQMSELIETPYGYAILLRLEPQNPLPEEKNPINLPNFPPPRQDDPRAGFPPPR